MSLLAGSFRNMEVRLAMSILEDLEDATKAGKVASQNEEAKKEIVKRSGTSSDMITADELNFFLTPHDLKRLDLYGRNLCDHHLVTDLLSTVARLFFCGRFGTDFNLSSLQAALVCGIGLQHKTVDDLKAELGLPENQVLAMFNKSVRKLSTALHGIVEEHEKKNMLSDKARLEAENKALRLKDVSRQTLEEDIAEGAKLALATLNKVPSVKLPKEITQEADIMKYAVEGTDEQWTSAVKNNASGTLSNVQIEVTKSVQKKRKIGEEDIQKEAAQSDPGVTGGSSKKKKKKKKSKSR